MALFDETPLSRTVREQSLGESDPYLRQYTPDLGGTAFRRGVDQSLGLGADYLGTVAEAAGAQDTARDLYGFSDRQMSEAQRQVAGPQTTGDVQGLGSAFEFGLNKAAESLPVSGTALGVAALSRSPTALGRIATAGAPIFPVVAGETSYSMRQDPNSTASPIERAVTATGAGAVSTALEVLPEVSAVGKLFNAAPSPAKTMAEAVLRGGKTAATSVAGEALTEGAQDVVSRGAQSLYNPEIGVNPVTDPEARQSFIESAAAGAAGGTVFGVPSGVATTLQSLPETQMPELPSGDALRQFIGETLTPRAERIAPEDIPANADDAVAAEMQRENTLTERARALRDRLMQRGDLTPEEQASIQDEVDLDPDAQEAVQNLADKKATEDTIRDSLSRIPAEGKPSRINPQVPLEEVDAIVKQAGIETEAASAPVRQWLSAYEPILKAGQVDSQTIDTALNVFGERGYSVLRAMAGDNQAALAVIDADQAQNGRLDTFLLQALKPEFRDSIRPGQLRQLGGLVRGAVDRGEGDIDSILETAFQNPQEVIAALQTGVGADTVGRGAATAETDEDQGQEATDDEAADVEFGDTQSIQDVEKRYFGNTRGNRRIKTGGLNIPWPMDRDKFADIVEVARNARGLAPESDVSEVSAVSALRELGVDPADVAAEMKITEQELRNMVFLQGSAPKPAVSVKTFVRMLKSSTIDKLNSEIGNPSAGSFLGIKSGNNHKAAIDVRKMVANQVFGKRDAASLMSAFADGVSTALEQGYKLDGPIPDDLVLARYGRGANEVVVTVGSARKELTKASKQDTDENFSLDPQTFSDLRDAGFAAGIDPRTGELQLPRSEVIRAIEAYAASVADRTAAARGIAKPAWVQELIAKHGTNFPASLGRVGDSGSVMARLRGWAIEQKIDSKALNALRVNAAKETPDVAMERRRKAEERQGPAMEGSPVDEAIQTEARTKGMATGIGPDAGALQAELGMAQLDADTLPAQLVEAAGVDPTRDPGAAYSVRGPAVRDFFSTAENAAAAHRQRFWATGDLPSGVNLQGVYATLGRIAAKGQPLQIVMSKQQGQTISPDVQKLLEAYQRRGFVLRTENTMAEGVPVQDSPYSQRVMARVLGTTGDNPAHAVLTLGDSQSAKLARRIGIPVIDLTNPVQQKIAGDILRAYDSSRRADISRSNDPAEVKAFKRKGEERTGTDRSRDLLTAGIEKALATNWNNPEITERLMRVGALEARVDNDFFDAGMAGREPIALANTIDALETYERQYNAERNQNIDNDPLTEKFIDLAVQVTINEKQSDPRDWTAAERAAYDSGDWEKFSELRGYTKAQIDQFREYLALANQLIAKYGVDETQDLEMSPAFEAAFKKAGGKGKPSLRMPGTEQTATEEQFDNARDYIKKVLPDDVRVIVRKMSTMSGLYSEVEQKDGDIDKFIELSSYAEDPMSVAHHESMHALVSALAEQKEQAPFIKALLKAANSPLVIGQLRSLLKNETQALEQMVNDPEERIAYMYEFWAAGKLNLASSVENWMVKLVRLVRGIFGVLDNNTKAGLYMAAFRDGQLKEPSAVNRVVMDSMSTPERVLRALPLAKKTERITRKVLETAHGRLKGYGNPALDKVADAFFADSSIGGQRSGYLQTVRDIVNLYGSQFAEVIRGSNEAELGDLAAALHSNKRPKNPELAERYDQTKALMRRLYNYMKASGIELPKVEDYFPQAWDKVAIEDNRQAFEDMLIENAQYRDKESGKLRNFTGVSAAAAAQTLLNNNGRLELTEDLAGFSPFMEASNERQIILKDRAKAAEYFDHDLVRIVTRYITQASKRGEYTRHFGQDGERLKGWLAEARAYGMTEEELQRDVSPAIRAMEGTLGHDINQYARDFMSGTMTVLNLAVLPLAVFSSLIDPMGIMVRGGTMEQSWNAFKAGVRNIPQSVRKEGKKLDIQDLAETIGTVESQNVLDMLGDMYGSAYMSDWARKTNNLMFRYNLMEGWNTAMRSAATVAALDFIERHAKGESKNSERWLDELGLSADTLVFDQQGKLVWKQADIAAELLRNGGDVSKAADISRRTREGITRWVDGAVLRPHAAHRPSWASDPRYMLIWHLKQFTYSFQKTILERVMHEARNGNYNPAIVLASYVPFMIAADYLRGLVQGAGEEPEWKKGQTFGEVVWEGTQRAGVLGVRQFAVDGGENPAFVLGPAANYALDAVEKTADGQVTDAIVQALPGNALWKGW